MDIDPFARSHDIFVHGIIHHLLEEDMDPVIGVSDVAETVDVHPRTFTDMLKGTEGLDLTFIVIVLRYCHKFNFYIIFIITDGEKAGYHVTL